MINGYVLNGEARTALNFCSVMQTEGIRPNFVTVALLLSSCASLKDFMYGRCIHGWALRNTRLGFLSRVEVATCLIDIYSKCGSLESAQHIFNALPMVVKDIYIWSVIIAGYGMHGHAETAVSLFRQMVDSGIKPNEVTFTSVLHACSHAGLVDDGLYLFNLMQEDTRRSPNVDHYTCIIDLLGRAGRLEEAYDIITTMPSAPSHAVWGALLGACVIHQKVELGELAAQSLFQLEPENTGNYILLAKLYAAVGRWKDAEALRDVMNDIGLRKEAAYSLTDM
ncbi:unnamed protein product [Linum tenue]|uniref:Pentatricopeptide repeat-containing protein n=1 Tax=Linum tenue TaxID=586396 RepID=A0AAV0KB37_9ROSI|nr:unnamed protein product [Linum tenue]